jgi:hypothetical protein
MWAVVLFVCMFHFLRGTEFRTVNGHEAGDKVRSPTSYRLNDIGYGCNVRRVVSVTRSNRRITRRVSDLCQLLVTVAAEVWATPC